MRYISSLVLTPYSDTLPVDTGQSHPEHTKR